MNLKASIKVKLFGISEKDTVKFATIFQISRPNKSTYYVENNVAAENIDIAIVNTDSGLANEQYKLFNTENQKVALVTVGSNQSPHHISGMLLPSRVYKVLDKVPLAKGYTENHASTSVRGNPESRSQQSSPSIKSRTTPPKVNSNLIYFGDVEPKAVEPKVAESEVAEPELVQPEVVEPELVEPEVVEPEVVEPEVVEPEVVESEVVESEVVESEVVESEVVEPEVVEPEVVESEVVESEVVESEVVESEVVESETVKPEVVEPEVVEPEVVEPEVVEPEVVEPEVVEPETVKPEVAEQELAYQVLVVDDSESMQKALQLELEQVDCPLDIDCAISGEEGLKRIDEKRYDLIFMDVMMPLPGIDGFEACSIIRKIPEMKKTPIIMLTSKTSPLDEVKGIVSGCTTYLTKPLKQDNFQVVMKRVLKWLENYRKE